MHKFSNFILAVIASAFRAVVASWLWFWFVVPLFNAPVVSFIVAWGISLIAAVYDYSGTKLEDGEVTDVLIEMIIYTAIVWGIGFVLSSFI